MTRAHISRLRCGPEQCSREALLLQIHEYLNGQVSLELADRFLMAWSTPSSR